MVLAKTVKGTLLLTDMDQMIYPDIDDDHVRDPYWVEGWIFLHELTSGDQIQITFSTYDVIGQVMRIYDRPFVTGLQEPVSAFHLGAIYTPWFRCQIKQTLAPGSYKNINYLFYEVA